MVIYLLLTRRIRLGDVGDVDSFVVNSIISYHAYKDII